MPLAPEPDPTDPHRRRYVIASVCVIVLTIAVFVFIGT